MIWEFDISLENIYNINEIEFNIRDFETQHVVVNTSVQTWY